MKLQDCLHLYLGCQGQVPVIYGYQEQIVSCVLEGINRREKVVFVKCRDIYGNEWDDYRKVEIQKFKPALRPLKDLKEDEAIECYNINYFYGNGGAPHEIYKADIDKKDGYPINIVKISYKGPINGTGYHSGQEYMYLNKLSSKQHLYLLSKHFDLFGLIESGLAIDSTTMK